MTAPARPSVSGWMASLVLGTYFGAWGFATVRAVLSGSVVKWLLLLAVCSALAVLQVMVLGAVDLILLWLKIRQLPNGRSAWTGSILSAFVIGVVGMGFVRFGTPLGMIASVIVPMMVISTAMRLFTGDRC
ncbi:MAG: hypothetical protein ACXWUG_00895 [Polyangiales bacterium]